MRRKTRKELEEQVKALSWNEQLGCYTRQAYENYVWPEIAKDAIWGIFFDVDDMKGLNSAGSWDKTSDLIKRSIVVRSGEYVVGQVLSGDEFFIALTEDSRAQASDPLGLCKRILSNFRKNGASATFAYGRITSLSYEEALRGLKAVVQLAKSENRRGSINAVEGGEQ